MIIGKIYWVGKMCGLGRNEIERFKEFIQVKENKLNMKNNA